MPNSRSRPCRQPPPFRPLPPGPSTFLLARSACRWRRKTLGDLSRTWACGIRGGSTYYLWSGSPASIPGRSSGCTTPWEDCPERSMGREILYCHQCQTRLTGTDFEERRAFHIENHATCASCAKPILQALPPDERARILGHRSDTRLRKAATPQRSETRRQQVKSTEDLAPSSSDAAATGSRFRLPGRPVLWRQRTFRLRR